VAITGRPTKMTEVTIQKLEEAFLMGCTDLEACLYADISKSLLYAYQGDNPDFLDRKETLKQNPFMLSRQVLIGALKDNDVNTAHKILERKEGKTINLQGGERSISVDAQWTIQPVRVENRAG